MTGMLEMDGMNALETKHPFLDFSSRFIVATLRKSQCFEGGIQVAGEGEIENWDGSIDAGSGDNFGSLLCKPWLC